GGSPSSAGPRGRRAPPQENAADSARPGFFARLHRCAIHAESHSVPERRDSTKAEGAGGRPAHIGLVPIDSLTGPRDAPSIASASVTHRSHTTPHGHATVSRYPFHAGSVASAVRGPWGRWSRTNSSRPARTVIQSRSGVVITTEPVIRGCGY